MRKSIKTFSLALILASSANYLRADEVDDYILAEMKARQIPGLAVAVVDKGEVIKAKGYGLANVELDVPVRPDTVFALASVTKQFTAAAIMLLVEEGRVRLDDKITKYIPKTPPHWNEITVRHLLTHTAGLKDRFEPTIDGTWLRDLSTARLLASAVKLPLDFDPGDVAQYSDQGYFLLGMVIEAASGLRYRDFLSEHIFKPLGMSSSSTVDWRKIVKNRASGYVLRKGELADNRRGVQVELSSHYGALSTVIDLVKWDAALYTSKILSASGRKQMWTPAVLNNGREVKLRSYEWKYGFGWALNTFGGQRVIEHGGSTGTHFLRLPDHRLTVIVLTNLDQISGSRPDSIARGVASIYKPSLLAPEAIQASNKGISFRAMNPAQALYDAAEAHCRKFGKRSGPVGAPPEQPDYEFVCTD